MGNSDLASVPFRFQVVKVYPARGPLRQYRLAASTVFTCCRCEQDKTTKLVATIRDDWNRLLCNACYGFLLSIWAIKAGDLEDVERDSELIGLLERLVGAAEVEQARLLLATRDNRTALLSPAALTLLATAEAVAAGFAVKGATELDWSAAIIGLCKAVEVEARRLVAEPLRAATSGLDLSSDLADRELGRLARFCVSSTPIELGTLARSLSLAVRSPKRASTSAIVTALRVLARRWPHSGWLFASTGFTAQVGSLARQYRNPAAHTALLTESDYRACAELVQGNHGILWRLLAAVEPQRE